MDIALKQRLVGATVLIALAVVILPMLLGGRPNDNGGDAQSIELPPQPSELDFETRRYPLSEQPTPTQDTRAEGRPALPTPKPMPEVAQQITEPVLDEPIGDELSSSVEQAPEVAPLLETDSAPLPERTSDQPSEAGPDLPPTTQDGSYVVQVGSFGSAQNATRLAEKLRGAGYGVLSDTVKSTNSTVHRVRVGPYASEEQADLAVSALTQALGDIKPRVIALSPPDNPASSRPADPMARWVVQVGSFSSATNADKLVAQLRLESHTAYQEQVSGSSGTIYRVRVGPYLDRDQAIRAEQQIKERMSLDGVVLSAD